MEEETLVPTAWRKNLFSRFHVLMIVRFCVVLLLMRFWLVVVAISFAAVAHVFNRSKSKLILDDD